MNEIVKIEYKAETRDALAKIKALRNQAKSFKSTVEGASVRRSLVTGQAVSATKRAVNVITGSFSRIRSSAESVMRSTISTFRRGFSAIRSIARNPLAITAGAVSGGAVAFSTGRAVLNSQRLANVARAVTDSQEAANTELAKGAQLAEKYGSGLVRTSEGYLKLLANAKPANISSEQTREIFESILSASVSLGISNDDLNGTFRALGQVMSKGTVQSEELRGQLGERIPGAFAIMARALNVTTPQLSKMLELGQVLAKDALPAFARELDKTFGGESERASRRFNREFNRILDSVVRLQVKLAEPFFEALESPLRRVRALVDDFANTNLAKQITGGLEEGAKILDVLLQGLQIGRGEFLDRFRDLFGAAIKGGLEFGGSLIERGAPVLGSLMGRLVSKGFEKTFVAGGKRAVNALGGVIIDGVEVILSSVAKTILRVFGGIKNEARLVFLGFQRDFETILADVPDFFGFGDRVAELEAIDTKIKAIRETPLIAEDNIGLARISGSADYLKASLAESLGIQTDQASAQEQLIKLTETLSGAIDRSADRWQAHIDKVGKLTREISLAQQAAASVASGFGFPDPFQANLPTTAGQGAAFSVGSAIGTSFGFPDVTSGLFSDGSVVAAGEGGISSALFPGGAASITDPLIKSAEQLAAEQLKSDQRIEERLADTATFAGREYGRQLEITKITGFGAGTDDFGRSDIRFNPDGSVKYGYDNGKNPFGGSNGASPGIALPIEVFKQFFADQIQEQRDQGKTIGQARKEVFDNVVAVIQRNGQVIEKLGLADFGPHKKVLAKSSGFTADLNIPGVRALGGQADVRGTSTVDQGIDPRGLSVLFATKKELAEMPRLFAGISNAIDITRAVINPTITDLIQYKQAIDDQSVTLEEYDRIMNALDTSVVAQIDGTRLLDELMTNGAVSVETFNLALANLVDATPEAIQGITQQRAITGEQPVDQRGRVPVFAASAPQATLDGGVVEPNLIGGGTDGLITALLSGQVPTVFDETTGKVRELYSELGNFGQSVAENAGGILESLTEGFGATLGAISSGTANIGEIWRGVAAQAVGSLARIGQAYVQEKLQEIFAERAAQSAKTASIVGTSAVQSAALTGPALLQSVISFGAAAAIGLASMVAINAITGQGGQQSESIIGFESGINQEGGRNAISSTSAAFAQGGLASINEIGQEFAIRPAMARKHRALLDRINFHDTPLSGLVPRDQHTFRPQGEYIVNHLATVQHRSTLEAINNDAIDDGFATGGSTVDAGGDGGNNVAIALYDERSELRNAIEEADFDARVLEVTRNADLS